MAKDAASGAAPETQPPTGPHRLQANLVVTALTIVVALLLTLAGAAAAVPLSSTALVDRPGGFGPLPFDGIATSNMESHSLSADGRFVVFSSSSDSLLKGDEDSAVNVYRLDRRTGSLAQVNVSAHGGQPSVTSVSNQASISADGRFVEFFSNASNLITGAPSDGYYVKDMTTGAIQLASRATGAAGAPARSLLTAVISGDGRHVAFTAFGKLHADNTDAIDGSTDAYVRSLDSGTTHMVSVSSAGTDASGVSQNALPAIDFHGDAVAFITESSLSPDDTTGDDDLYVRTGIGSAGETTHLVSFTTGQTAGADTAEEAALSGDGKLAAWSTAEGCCSGQIFMASVVPAVTAAQRIDVPRPGGTGSGGGDPVFEPVASGTKPSARLYFRSDAALDPADTNGGSDLYAAEPAHPGDGNFVHLETTSKANGDVRDGTGAAAGAVVAFDSAASSLPGADGVNEQAFVSGGGHLVNVSQPVGSHPRTSAVAGSFIDALHAVSADGRVVVFSSPSPVFGGALTSQSLDGFNSQVLARNVVSGQTTLVSASATGAVGDSSSRDPSVDSSANKVAFLSTASNLGSGPNPTHVEHVYVRDLGSGQTTLVDRTSAGAPLSGGVKTAEISADGTHLVYSSNSPDAPQAPPGDFNTHVYVVDLVHAEATVLADRSNDGTPANADARNPDIDGDGSRVAFVSIASNLGGGNPMGGSQIYVRDLRTNKIVWASVPQDGNPVHDNADEASISRSGTRVAFIQLADGFGFGMVPGSTQVFVHDLVTGTTTLASRGPNGAPVGRAAEPSLSDDGSRVLFATEPPAESALQIGFQVFLRELSRGTTALVSVGRAGGPAHLGAFVGSLSGNGGCAAFDSNSTDLTIPSYGPDYGHVFLRAVSQACPAGAPHDTTPPRISGAHLTHRRFEVGSGRTAIVASRTTSQTRHQAARGTSFVFTLSENARTTIAISHHVPGIRIGHRCRPRRHGVRPSCKRTVTVVTLSRQLRRGGNKVRFSGRVGRLKLKPGSYRARLVAEDAAGNRSRPVTLTFTVLAGSHR